MSDYPMLISNKLHSFRNFALQTYGKITPETKKESYFFGTASPIRSGLKRGHIPTDAPP